MKETHWGEKDTAKWYDRIVGESGHYYHQSVIFPNLIRLLDLNSASKVLDLGCGQGILARQIPKEISYTGIDFSKPLIQTAKEYKNPNAYFLVADICKPLPLEKRDFTHATILLALQNVAHPEKALQAASHHLIKGGSLFLVLNHPCFRIPRQSHWGIDEQKKIQYRRIDRYLSPLKIPVLTNPGKGQKSEQTFSFHHSLSDISKFLHNSGFCISLIEEWTSDKKSTGKTAVMENRARLEFPLFLAIKAKKCNN